MKETATITLGEKEYTVKTLPFKRSRQWRKRFADDVKPIFDKVTSAQDMSFERPEDLLQVWPIIETLLFEGLDTLFDLLLAYSPELEADRDAIEDSATDKQVLAAFQEVLRIADPFGLLARLDRKSGPLKIGTSPNLRLPNGDSIEVRQTN